MNIKQFTPLFILVTLTLSTLLVACRKDVADPEVTVTFNIASPLASTTYDLGDTVFVNVTITGSEELHGYEVDMNNLTGDSTVFDAHAHNHASSFTINGYFVNNVTDHSEMELRVKAFIDHDDNYKEKVVEFHCHPD